MSNFPQFSRRKFLTTAAASGVSAVFLNGCLGTPPSVRDITPKVEALELSPEQKPEITAIKLGYLPILESAPLVIAKQKGFFDRYGMTEVEV
ncbi:MAG: ABC transporter substrate-binding protein, partial [Waterburya sp.]